jgi:hypothetical protein
MDAAEAAAAKAARGVFAESKSAAAALLGSAASAEDALAGERPRCTRPRPVVSHPQPPPSPPARRPGPLHRHVVLHLVSHPAWPVALLARTGPDAYWDRLKGAAKAAGYRLTEHALRRVEVVKVKGAVGAGSSGECAGRHLRPAVES